jgi:predicted DNA-binding protein
MSEQARFLGGGQESGCAFPAFPHESLPWKHCSKESCICASVILDSTSNLYYNMYYKEATMTSVRLPFELEQRLEIFAREKNKSKTDIIRQALEKLFHQEDSGKDSYELGEEYFGKYGSGDGSLSVTYKTSIKDRINAKLHSG